MQIFSLFGSFCLSPHAANHRSQAHDIVFDKQSSKGSLSPVLCNRVCLDLEIDIIITNCIHTRVLLMFLYDADLIKAAVVEDNNLLF